MSDPQHSPDHLPEEHPEVQEEPYVPASPVKRTLAWKGGVYMVIIVALTTYNLATGFPLRGAPGIMLFPACGALSVLSFLRFKADHRGSMLILGIAAAAACMINLALGMIALIAQQP